MSGEGLRWYPQVTIDKYSPDQVAYARERREVVSLPSRLALPRREVLHGDVMRLLFRVPEGGTETDEGNGMTGYGAANIALVLAGEGGFPLAAGTTAFGVGADGETGFSSEHVRLANDGLEEAGRSWYIPMDQGYPHVGAPAELHGQATFTEMDACFEWKEWCWAAGPHPPKPHHNLLMAYGGDSRPVMVNHKASQQGYGVKEAGVAWVFRTQVRLLA